MELGPRPLVTQSYATRQSWFKFPEGLAQDGGVLLPGSEPLYPTIWIAATTVNASLYKSTSKLVAVVVIMVSGSKYVNWSYAVCQLVKGSEDIPEREPPNVHTDQSQTPTIPVEH